MVPMHRREGNNAEATSDAGGVSSSFDTGSSARLPRGSGSLAGAPLHCAPLAEQGGDVPRYVPSHHELELIRIYYRRWHGDWS